MLIAMLRRFPRRSPALAKGASWWSWACGKALQGELGSFQGLVMLLHVAELANDGGPGLPQIRPRFLEKMLQLIVDAACHWMRVGLPLHCLKIACLPGNKSDRLIDVFRELKKNYSTDEK